MALSFLLLNIKMDGKLVESDIPTWLLKHKKTKMVSKDVTIAATSFAEYTVSLGLSGIWLITGFNPYVNGEMNAFVTSSHMEANNIKISVTNQATGARTVNVGAVIDYIQW